MTPSTFLGADFGLFYPLQTRQAPIHPRSLLTICLREAFRCYRPQLRPSDTPSHRSLPKIFPAEPLDNLPRRSLSTISLSEAFSQSAFASLPMAPSTAKPAGHSFSSKPPKDFPSEAFRQSASAKPSDDQSQRSLFTICLREAFRWHHPQRSPPDTLSQRSLPKLFLTEAFRQSASAKPSDVLP